MYKNVTIVVVAAVPRCLLISAVKYVQLRAFETLLGHEAFKSTDERYNVFKLAVLKFQLQYRNVTTQSNRHVTFPF